MGRAAKAAKPKKRHGARPGERRGGRKAGTPNKRTVLFEHVAQAFAAEGVDPAVIIAKGMAGTIKSPLKLKCAEIALKYLHPQRKAVEVSGIGGGPINVDGKLTIVSPRERIASKLAELAARTSAGTSSGTDGSGVQSS